MKETRLNVKRNVLAYAELHRWSERCRCKRSMGSAVDVWSCAAGRWAEELAVYRRHVVIRHTRGRGQRSDGVGRDG